MHGMIEPAVRQLELLRSGEISVAELAEAHIQQIERLNPQLNVSPTSMRSVCASGRGSTMRGVARGLADRCSDCR
jgi:Asp-tRNA(Asn)/Glu-tRNA(Gln) amidotransferase A subunit family amidase